ncbi:MAG: hypothetical protein ABEJ28_08035 [Salinigranum sp.]
MSTPSIERWLRGRRLDTGAAILGLLIAVALFPLRFLASEIYIETVPLVLGTACVLYLLSGERSRRTEYGLATLSAPIAQALPVAVFAGNAALIVVAVNAGVRSILFYDVAGVVGTLIVAQILLLPDEEFRRGLLLAQIVVLAGALRLTALYVTPGFIGIDIWTHLPRLAHRILARGTLSAIADNKYYAAPFYHLYVVGGDLLFGSSLRTALYLSLGLLMPLASLLVYATARLLVEERWAVFAAMLYAVADYTIEWSLHLIPTSHGLLLFLGVLYAITRIMQIDYRVRDFVVLLALSVGVILTHQVSTFVMLVLLVAALVAHLAMEYGPFGPTPVDPNPFGVTRSVNLLGMLVFDAGFTLFMWSFTPMAGADKSFLALVLSYLEETLNSSAGLLNIVGGPGSSTSAAAAGASSTLVAQVATYVDKAGFLLLLGAGFVGCLYVVNQRRASQPTFTLLFASAFMLVFVLGLPLFGIRNFVPQRWIAFLYAPLAVLAAIGFRYLSSALDRRLFVALVVLFALAYPSAMVMSSNGAVDNPLFPHQRERLSYDRQELTAVSTIGAMTGSPDRDQLTTRQVLFTDHPYETVFSRTGSYPAGVAVVNRSRPSDQNFVVYRRYDSTGAPTFRTRPDGSGKVDRVPRSGLCRPTMGVVYANGDVTMCSAP